MDDTFASMLEEDQPWESSDMPEMVALTVDADSFMAGMILGLLANEPDGSMPGFGAHNHGGHHGMGGFLGGEAARGGERNLTHVLANGSCFEGHGNPAALRALYDASFKSAVPQPGACPNPQDAEGLGAFVRVFPMSSLSASTPPLLF